jgi:hypothetical protein
MLNHAEIWNLTVFLLLLKKNPKDEYRALSRKRALQLQE